MENVYTVEYCSDQQYYVDGVGNGLGYYSGYLNPNLRFGDNKDMAEIAAKVANITYQEGYKQAQRDIRKSLGIVA